jgi:DNA-directed RNA polymerase subunit RPC12/RpoP
MDTVFKYPAEEVFYDRVKNVIWSPDGLGADDRAGVFAIIQVIKQGLRPHIILTTDEEIGAKGASALASIDNPFEDLRYIIQLDRRGANDCVFYDCDNKDFVKYVEQFGFIENYGSFSDISEICPAWKIAGVNLSVGYQDEHSVAETLHISPFLTTIERVINMLKDVNNVPAFKYIPNPYAYRWNYLHQSAWESEYLFKCHKCKTPYTEYELFPVKSLDGKAYFYCPDCIVGNVHWCTVCGDAFEPSHKHEIICKDCQKEM